MADQLPDQTVCTPEQCRESCGGTTFGTCAYPTPADLEVARLRAELVALKVERVTLRAAVRVWLASPQAERDRLEGIRRSLNDQSYAMFIARQGGSVETDDSQQPEEGR